MHFTVRNYGVIRKCEKIIHKGAIAGRHQQIMPTLEGQHCSLIVLKKLNMNRALLLLCDFFFAVLCYFNEILSVTF